MRADGAVLGWDVGGANLKAVRLEPSGEVLWRERSFEVWRDPAGLRQALAAVGAELGPARAHGVTMTAELSDCFATKREGVVAVLSALRGALTLGGGSVELRVADVSGGFLSAERACRDPFAVAGANWAAAARWLSRSPELVGDGAVLLDVGSTTADVIPLVRGRVLSQGRTDPERLVEGELVYVGAQRTPVCALLTTAPFRGRECPVAAEHFAIAADAHVWLGTLPESEYRCATPDGAATTRAASRARLARVVCADAEMLADVEVTAIAQRVVEAQLERLGRAVQRVASGVAGRPRALLAGSGRWLAARAAERAGLAALPLDEALGDVARALPAYAVARLLALEAAGAAPLAARAR